MPIDPNDFYSNNFWIDDRYPNDWLGNPAYPPHHPGHPQFRRMSKWTDLGPHGQYLRSEETKWVWMHPATNWRVWHLSGAGRGKEGVVLARDLEGVLQPEFEIKYSVGPYIVGEDPQRIDYRKRTINFGVWLLPDAPERYSGGGPFAYRRVFDAWSRSWSPKQPGYLGSFTRTHGWRWLALILGEASKTTLDIDPAANGKMLYHMTAHAPWPMYSKRSLTKTWKAHFTDLDEHNVCTGKIKIPNRGTWECWPKVIFTGAGDWTMSDGDNGPMVRLPRFYASDGRMMMVDTDPTRRTVTTEREPVDNQLYKFMRNSQLLDLLLRDITAARLPAQRRIPGGVGFLNAIAPRSVANLTFTTTNPIGTATVICPQFYQMAWS